MKGNHPKRRKDKYNPYNIFELDGKYYIEFSDGQKKQHCIEINRELYDVFDRAELEELKYLNIIDRHIEQSEIYEITMYKRSGQSGESAENEAIRKIILNDLYTAISKLPTIQRRRLILYYFVGLTYEQIAEMESCSFQAIAKSVTTAEKKLKKLLEQRVEKSLETEETGGRDNLSPVFSYGKSGQEP